MRLADLGAWALRGSFRLLPRSDKELRLVGPDPEVVRVPTRHGSVRCLVYRPETVADSGPVYIHFHGGAFIVRSPEQDEHVARRIVDELQAIVVSVDYDTAPRVAFPVAEEECIDVARWIAARFTGPIAVGGFSAGGKLAINVVQQGFDAAALVVAYPALDMTLGTGERHSTLRMPAVSPWLIRLMYATYFAGADRTNRLASPLLDPEVAYFPPTLLETGGLDAVRAEGDRFVDLLAESGVDVTHRVFEGSDHGFTGDKTAGPDAIALIIDHLRAHVCSVDGRGL
ncbi:alpha/beta hydrolase fold domain-containing protein [Rhodococcoides yunnanense]|uniref:alpha/beta hydrolase fold domain-containing protein n=1 Tax=Rhodococcoides yunnanense TaxID=278209 RepID=UPI0009320CD9|nr:alpha/beta hydrolase fold domain-containing protein [Rhodococcus yunnanensis]